MRSDDGPLARVRALFPEREIFLRSRGTVRFVRISTGLQAASIATVGGALLIWGSVTIGMVVTQAHVSAARASLDRRQADVDRTSAKVDAFRRSAASIAEDIEQRQHLIEALVKSRIGPIAPSPKLPPSAAPAVRTSAAMPDAAAMHRLEAGQRRFVGQLVATFDARSARAAAALRALGLDPSAMLARARVAQGGPFIPWQGATIRVGGDIRLLADAVERLDVLEDNLATIPSGRPTDAPMITSSYGLRRDPFNGYAAFHAGIDFVGRYGQPILAAAAGRVIYVGPRQGYGQTVEIDHGNGLVSRYAHLSAYVAHVGEAVVRGQQVARMGSTGRSTGTHLHFEVRVNGQSVNPRRFLEAKPDVFQAQQSADNRHADLRHRG